MKNKLKKAKFKNLGYVEGSYLSGVKIKILGYEHFKTRQQRYALVAEYYGLPIPGTKVSINKVTYNEITSQFDKSGYAFTKAAQICKLKKKLKFNISLLIS